MQMENLNFYILTGGPGSGKSTVLKLLSDMGYLTVEETGRNIIQKQIKSLGDAVPWNNVSRYARLMFLHAITDFEELVHVQKTCFFDRGILDILGYCRLINIPIATSLKKAAHEYRYNPKVFLFPPWEEIYTNDTERKQDFKEAERTYHTLKNVYEEFGYQTIIVPCLIPVKRAQWIVENLNKHIF